MSILLNMIVIFVAKTSSKHLLSSSYPDIVNRPDGHGFCGSYLPNPKFTDSNSLKNYNSPGMPSGHSSMAWFLATFFLLKLWNENTVKNKNIKYFSTVVIILFATGVSLSRTSLLEGCHTYPQIIVGGILGIIFGLVVYYLKDIIKKRFIK